MQERMVNQFEQVPKALIDRSKFDRSSRYITTIDEDYLYPVFFDEVLPGDTKELNTTIFGRMTTAFVPFMDNVYLDYHLYFVPYRLIWSNFKKFMGEQENPGDSTDYIEPQIVATSSGFTRHGLLDYLSIPPAINGLSVSAKFTRAYNLIWNEWYRDENLQNSVKVDTGDGPDSETDYVLLKRGKRFDYFTSCLPSPQKGAGASIPLGSTADVSVFGTGNSLGLVNGTQTLGLSNGGSGVFMTTNGYDKTVGAAITSGSTTANVAYGVTTDATKSGLKGICDLTSATSATINSLRQAIALQQFLEKDMRGGTRYKELVYSHFGVMIPDLRLQRPEYLGGATTKLYVSPVTQTSATDSVTPQGNLSAISTVASTGNGFTKSFTEHGVILGLVSIRTDLTYQQGIDRMFSRKTRYDYFWPTLAHLGEQEVKNKEIFAQGAAVTESDGVTLVDDGIFGYQERYAEYRFKNSYITSYMRSSDPETLDVWHLSQNFANLPVLNDEFIELNSPISRVLAVPGTAENPVPHFYLDLWHELTDIRPIPVYGTPGLMRI